MTRKREARGFTHGATFGWDKIRKALDEQPWEVSDEDPTVEVRRVWLGTVFALTPSGKIYAPFACSNVAGDCKVCGGHGIREPRAGRRSRKRAARRTRDFARATLKRGKPWDQSYGLAGLTRYIERVKAYRAKAYAASSLACPCCDGTGSASAARDERWNEALEAAAETIGAYVDHYDDSIFITESREAVETSPEEEDAHASA